MSRSYRIKVSQSLRRVIHAEDHVSTQLELLEILPCDQMADLLGRELQELGFEIEDGTATRTDGDVTVTVELATGTITVQSEGSQDVNLKGEKQGVAYEESQSHAKDNLRQQLTRELEENAARQEQALQNDVTEQLEAELANLRDELDTAVNRATAQALKQKAAQIGQIKEMTEDPQSGSLTIVVEV